MRPPLYGNYTEHNHDFVRYAPSHWVLGKLGYYLADLIAGGTPPRDNLDYWSETEGGIPWVTIGDLTRAPYVRTTEQRITEDGRRAARLHVLPKGTIIYSIYATLGKVAILDLNAATNQAILGLLPRQDAVIPRYCLWWLRALEPWVKLQASSNTQDNLSAQRVRDLPFLVPTRSEQQAIADFLDHETARIDALIEEQQRLVEVLSEERDARITHAVTRGLDTSTSTRDSGLDWLGDIPAHWEVRKISTVTDKVTNGYVGPTRGVLKDSGVRYLQSLHIKRNQIIFDPPYYVDEQWSQNHNKSILREGDVLVVQTGDIGQVAYVPEEFAGSNCHALIILSPINNVLEGRFLSWVLNSSYGFNSLKSVQTGALHPHLNCGYVRDIYIPLPPVQEQSEIARYIDETEREFDDLVGQIRSGESLLKERRSAVISAAVTGKIDVREWRQPTPATEAIVPQVAEKESRYG